MVDWKTSFDRVHCIHYVNSIDRMQRISTELTRVGILDSGIFDWWYDYDSPFFKMIQKNSIAHSMNTGICEDRQFNYFKCSFSHYRLWKDICARKTASTLILEDDEVFLKDIDLLNDIIKDSAGIGCDLILFDKFSCGQKNEYAQNISNPDFSISQYFRAFSSGLRLFSGGAYSISLRAAQLFSQMYEYKIIQCDNMWNVDTDDVRSLRKAFSKINICCQQPYSSTNCSTVNFEFAYKCVGLDKSLYNFYEYKK